MSLLDRFTGGGTPEPTPPRPEQVQNPANAAKTAVRERGRVSLATPMQKLEVPDIPGFVLQWFSDRPGRISRSQAGGYEFVGPDEVQINNFGLAADVLKDGNTDLGSRISVYGGANEDGSNGRLYLMKIRREWWEEDEKVRADRNEAVAASIRGGKSSSPNPHEEAGDAALKYGGAQEESRPRVVKSKDNLFTRKR